MSSVNHGVWRDGWYVVPHQVLFRDLDAFGHVNNAVFFTYYEWGRTAYWFDLTGAALAHDIGFIVARAECDFKLQLELEQIEIATRIGEMRNSSFVFESEIRKSDGQQIAATGRVVVVLFDWETNAKKPIDAELRKRIEEFQAG